MASNVPEIRFHGFDGEWNNRFLTDVAMKRKIINSNMQEDNLLSLSYGKIKRKDIRSNKGLLPSSFSSYQIIDRDTIVFRFTDLQNDQKSLRVGLSREKGIVSSAYVCVDPDKEIFNPDFLYWLLHYYDTQKVFYKMGDGIRQTITYEDLREMNLAFPSKEEQNLIASFVNNIDDSINRQESECEKLRNLKSALLVSLFPQGNETQPKLRLNGFSGDWDEFMAIDVFQPISEKGHPELPILSASQELGMIPRSENGIDMSYGTQNVASYKRVSPGQFVIHLRSFQGGFAHSSIEGITSPAYTILRFKNQERHFDIFWKYVLVSKPFIKRLETVTYGIRDGKSIKFEDFSNMKFLVPSMEEQKAISNLLLEYDCLIQLNEQKLEKLRNLKQAMLDKMFV